MTAIASTSTGHAGVRPEAVFGLGLIGFLALASFPRIALQDNLLTTFLGVGAALAAWFAIVLAQKWRGRGQLEIQRNLVASHYVQGTVQVSIFLYWSFYWELIAHNGLLILGQVVFAYLFDALLSWSRNRPWRLGFGPFPIIFSTNLFLCFKDDWFQYQFAIIALAFLVKEFLTWERHGRRTHIFNPSAFPLFVFSILLISTNSTSLTWAQEIATKLNNPDHIFLWIFVVGLIVQALFHVTLVTLAAALALAVLNLGYTAATGTYWFLDAGIPIAVFLGMHLLVTDPATSPRNNIGRFLFGLLYGASVFALYGVLEYLGEPSFYDKLLCVPVLNLLVIYLERLGSSRGWFARSLGGTPFKAVMSWSPAAQNRLAMAAWIPLFGLMYWGQLVGPQHQGHSTSFWRQACSDELPGACASLERVHRNRCTDGDSAECLALASLLGRTDPQANRKPLLEAESLACEFGARAGCIATDQLLSEQAPDPLESACDGGDAMDCYLVGANALKGIGRPQDLDRAFEYFTRACDMRLGIACSLLGDGSRYGVAGPQDLDRAMRLYERSCGLCYAPACMALSGLFDGGQGISRDEGLSQWYRRKACAVGLAEACQG